MTILQAAFLGIVQGLTEFLPISSSGHLILVEHFLDLDVEKLLVFDVAVHAGTLCALLIYFWRDIVQLFADLVSPTKWQRLIIPLVIGTIPAVVFGLLSKDWLEANLRSPLFVALMMLLTATLLVLTDIAARWSTRATIDNLGWKKALEVGCFQMLAILPGVSRSGSTIAGGVFVGMKKVAAARFSFLLGMIAILGAVILSIPDLTSTAAVSTGAIWTGFLTAFVSGLLTVWLFLKLLPKIPLWWFSIYLVVVAGFILLKLT